ncbi:MAG TPA: glycosyltransferase family 4 protein [Verrucomicrobiae bacterium]|nr:glycosyltransferase family 4 protein [Verrucomicrobiae bacterium]
MKPRVLFAHQWNSTGGLYGSDKVLLDFLKYATASIDPIVAIESEGAFAEIARAIPSEVIILNMGVLRQKHMTPTGIAGCGLQALRSALWLSRYIRRHNIAAVVSNTVSVLAGAMSAKLSRKPHIWLIHEILGGKARLLAPVVRQFSDRVIAVSQASAESVGVSDRIAIAYPGVNVVEFDKAAAAPLRKLNGLREETVLIGMIGRIHYWKGQDYFLDAVAELKRRRVTDFAALIIGDVYAGYEDLRQRLIAKAQALGVADSVIFCGHLNDLASVYKALDIVVAPSTRADPFCLVVAEGMAAARPVISTNWGGPKEIIEDGVSGILVPPSDPTIFADALQRFVREPALRRRVGEAGRRRIECCFSRDSFNTRVLQSLKSVLNC